MRLVSIHVLAGRTTALDASRFIGTNAQKQSQSSQQKPARSQQSCTLVRGCEALAAICCDCNLWKPRTQYTKNIFWPPEKEQTKQQFYNNNSRKVVISNSIPDALRSRTYNGCLWKPAERNKVCMSKQRRFVASTEIFIGDQALHTFQSHNFSYSQAFRAEKWKLGTSFSVIKPFCHCH